MSIENIVHHTRGPWVVSTEEDIGKGWMVATTGDYVIEVRGRKGDELGDQEADARLIAAAPMLCAALHRLIYGAPDKEAWQIARNALMTALGGNDAD